MVDNPIKDRFAIGGGYSSNEISFVRDPRCTFFGSVIALAGASLTFCAADLIDTMGFGLAGGLYL
jgi:hypothetical protein